MTGLLFSEGLIQEPGSLDVLSRDQDPDSPPGLGNVMNVLLEGDVRAARERHSSPSVRVRGAPKLTRPLTSSTWSSSGSRPARNM
jgi:hypothetical protein